MKNKSLQQRANIINRYYHTSKKKKAMKKKLIDTLKEALERLANVNGELRLQPVPVRVGNRFGNF